MRLLSLLVSKNILFVSEKGSYVIIKVILEYSLSRFMWVYILNLPLTVTVKEKNR